MKTRIVVLFTACGGWPTCGTIDALKRSEKYDFYVIGADCSPNPAELNYVDRLYKVPRCTESDFIDALHAICVAEKVQIVVPLISDEIEIIASNRKRFEDDGIAIPLSKNLDLLKIANDKYLLEEFLLQHGIDIMPKSILVTKDNFESALNALGYPDKPVCLKQRNGCGSKGFRVIFDKLAKEAVITRSRALRTHNYVSKQQVMEAIDNLGNDFMLQEHVGGRELGTICLCDNGDTVYEVSHDNIAMEMSTTTCCELVHDEEASRIVKKLNRMFEFDGNIGYDFKRTDDGQLKLLEINPRISATVSLAAKAGLNLVELGVLHRLGLPYDKDIVPNYGMRLMRNYGTLYELDGVPCGR